MASTNSMREVLALGAPTRKDRRYFDPNAENTPKPAKRQADHSPINMDHIKRSALGDLTNNVKRNLNNIFAQMEEEMASPRPRPKVARKPVFGNMRMQMPDPMPILVPTKRNRASQVMPLNPVPADVEDFDRKNWDDHFQVSNYAMDIIDYLKEREEEFPIDDYMPRQIHLTTKTRTLLIDWMVEVQETFELTHETLHLAVKIVDLYLCRQVIQEDKLQLLGAVAFFIACKYDESKPPLMDDFLYICDGAYNQKELERLEREALGIIGYDLGMPLSDRFLRRYGSCAQVPMPTLTLARYILEMSLMDYDTIGFSDSQMAAAALFMALRMHGIAGTWSPTLVYYTGYQLEELAEIVPVLNAGLHRKPRSTIMTVRNKYSTKIFYEVAKVPLMTNQEMFKDNLDLNADC